MVTRMHSYTSRVLKAARTGKTSRAHYDLAMAFSWSLAIANRLGIDLDVEIWKRYPGHCPYCLTAPCSCCGRAENRGQAEPHGDKPVTLRDYQQMFYRLYPDNTLEASASHLAEEVGELDEAIEFYTGTHDTRLFEDVIIELVDVDANICAVASCLNIGLPTEMGASFQNGCPKCFQTPCTCGFTVAKSVSIR